MLKKLHCTMYSYRMSLIIHRFRIIAELSEVDFVEFDYYRVKFRNDAPVTQRLIIDRDVRGSISVRYNEMLVMGHIYLFLFTRHSSGLSWSNSP